MGEEYDEKVMLNVATALVERADALRNFVARQSLRGRASRSDVMRAALSLGLHELERQEVKAEQ